MRGHSVCLWVGADSGVDAVAAAYQRAAACLCVCVSVCLCVCVSVYLCVCARVESELSKPPPESFGLGADGLAPSSAFAGSSGKEGPKGVLADYASAQADLMRRVREKSPAGSWGPLCLHVSLFPSPFPPSRGPQREVEALKRAEYVRRVGMGATTDEPSVAFNSKGGREARKLAAMGADEVDERLAERREAMRDKAADAVAAAAAAASDDGDTDAEDDDEFGDDDHIMAALRRQRLEELKRMAAKKKFGVVKEVSKFELLTETDEEVKDVWVVVHLYETVRFCWCCRLLVLSPLTASRVCSTTKVAGPSTPRCRLSHGTIPTSRCVRVSARCVRHVPSVLTTTTRRVCSS